MNVVFDIYIRFFTENNFASVLLLKNEGTYMTAVVISYMGHRNDYTGQMWYRY
jgi:hypothetical protein